MIKLFEGVEELLNKIKNDYQITYQQMQEEKEGLGIFMYPGGNDKVALSGESVYEVIKVHIQIHSKTQNVAQHMAYLRNVCDIIENEQPKGFQIIYAQHIGPKVDFIGTNSKGLSVLGGNYLLYYNLD